MAISTEKMGILYIQGRQSVAQISEMDGRSETKVYHLLKDNGVHMRGRSEANQTFPDFVFRSLYNMGLSSTQVGRLLGVHSTTVIKRLSGMGFPMRPKSLAALIGYTDQEFNEFFCGDDVSGKLMLIEMATNGDTL